MIPYGASKLGEIISHDVVTMVGGGGNCCFMATALGASC